MNEESRLAGRLPSEARVALSLADAAAAVSPKGNHAAPDASSPLPRPSTPSRPRPEVDPVPDSVLRASSWIPIDLVAEASSASMPPEIVGLFYVTKNHLISGESETLKSWLVLAASVDELNADRGVLWVDGDDVGAGDVLERLRSLGAEDDAISRLFIYVQPDDPLNEARRQDLLDLVRARRCRLVVFDGFNPLLVLNGLDSNSGPDVERFYRLIDPFRKAGAANVLTDNVVKSPEHRGKWAIGSERKKSKAEATWA
jgi:AAA domain